MKLYQNFAKSLTKQIKYSIIKTQEGAVKDCTPVKSFIKITALVWELGGYFFIATMSITKIEITSMYS